MNDSTTVAVMIFGTLVLTLFAFFMIIFVVLQKRRQYRHILDKQQMEHQYQSELLRSRIEVQEQSFRYFSQEIHDNVGQILALVKIQLYKISKNAPTPELLKEAQLGTELTSKAITDLRNLSHTANDKYVLNADLIQIIEKELYYISSAKNIECTFTQEGQLYDLGDEQNLLVFRIIQESMANALRHGEATVLNIVLHYKPNRFSVVITDNGTGFDTDTIKSGGGLGLNNMVVRADLLKGKLDIRSEKGKGTIITLDIPH